MSSHHSGAPPEVPGRAACALGLDAGADGPLDDGLPGAPCTGRPPCTAAGRAAWDAPCSTRNEALVGSRDQTPAASTECPPSPVAGSFTPLTAPTESAWAVVVPWPSTVNVTCSPG